jgi:predicted RNase H-like nuclease (RuvC/YqgF family)
MWKTINSRLRWGCLVLLGTCAACGAPDDNGSSIAMPNRETITPAPPPPATEAIPLAADGSIAALTAEIRQLRVAVQELARSQQEAQTFSATLLAQQNRVERAAEQLQNVREIVKGQTFQIDQIDSRLSSLSEELLLATDLDRRQNLERQIRQARQEKNNFESQLQRARSEESELLRELQTEQRQWDELVGGGQ